MFVVSEDVMWQSCNICGTDASMKRQRTASDATRIQTSEIDDVI